MTVDQLREAIATMPGHWPVHVEVKADRDCTSADWDYLFTLEAVPSSFPTQGCMAVIRINYEPR